MSIRKFVTSIDTAAVVFACIVIALLVLLGSLFYLSFRSDDKWAQSCRDKGGHTVQVSKGRICLDSNDVYLGKND